MLPEGKEVSPLFMFNLALFAEHHLLSVEYGDNEEFTFFSFLNNTSLLCFGALTKVVLPWILIFKNEGKLTVWNTQSQLP